MDTKNSSNELPQNNVVGNLTTNKGVDAFENAGELAKDASSSDDEIITEITSSSPIIASRNVKNVTDSDEDTEHYPDKIDNTSDVEPKPTIQIKCPIDANIDNSSVYSEDAVTMSGNNDDLFDGVEHALFGSRAKFDDLDNTSLAEDSLDMDDESDKTMLERCDAEFQYLTLKETLLNFGGDQRVVNPIVIDKLFNDKETKSVLIAVFERVQKLQSQPDNKLDESKNDMPDMSELQDVNSNVSRSPLSFSKNLSHKRKNLSPDELTVKNMDLTSTGFFNHEYDNDLESVTDVPMQILKNNAHQ
jgi:hypothetical protein